MNLYRSYKRHFFGLITLLIFMCSLPASALLGKEALPKVELSLISSLFVADYVLIVENASPPLLLRMKASFGEQTVRHLIEEGNIKKGI